MFLVASLRYLIVCRIGTRVVSIVSSIVLGHVLVLCLVVVAIIVVIVNGRGSGRIVFGDYK